MDPIENCQRAVNGARALINTLTPADLATPTPCTEWDVKALVNHMVGVCTGFTRALGGTVPAPPGTASGDDDLVGNEPAAAYDRVADAVMQAWRAPGALDRTVKLALGEMPGRQAAAILVADQLVHTWDLAKAIGRPHGIDEDLARATYEMMRQNLTPELRQRTGAFGPEVECPESAPIQDRLAAFAGRRP